jgi:creatinine amidohydrolase
VSRLLAERSGPATAELLTEDSILVLPTGAIEHHGPHLPLVTDTLVAEAAATAAVERAAARGVDVWQLPTLSITKSDEHSWAPGTLWLTPETLLSTVVDIGRSITTTPARTLVFVNGHGGNVALLNVALRELRRRFGLRTFFMPAGVPHAADGTGETGDEHGMAVHGGYSETSVVMHLRPDLVDASRFAPNVPAHIAGFRHIGFNGKPVSFGWLSDDFGPSGIVGDPSGASAAAGAALFEAGVAFVAEALEEISRFRHRAA